MGRQRRPEQAVLRAVLILAVLSSLALLGALLLTDRLPLRAAPAPPSPPPPTRTTNPVPTGTTPPTSTPTTPTIAPSPTETVVQYTFAVCGDSRIGDDIYREILQRVQQDGSQFLFNTGDLVNHGLEAEFQHFAELMADFTLPFYPAPGNHDASGGDLSAYLEYSGAPAAHYAFDYENGRFIVVDSHHGGVNTPELTWLEEQLATNVQPLTFVFLHHPPYDPDGTDYTMQWGNERFMSLMEKYDVDIVFAGHIHAYTTGERNGVQYIVTGGGGAPLYGGEHPQAFYHYVRVEIVRDQVSTEVVKIETSP